MATLTEHLIRLTDHRDRDLLELTLAKALIDLVPIQRVVVARVLAADQERRWLDVVALDAGGGGKLADPLRIDFDSLPQLEDAYDRLRSLRGRQEIEVAWAGERGPRIYYVPLFPDSRADDDQGVIEVHTAGVMAPEHKLVVDQLHHIYRNMYTLLAHSDRDALTGLLNRKALDDTFYSAVLEELDGVVDEKKVAPVTGKERRHRVPHNYWLGSVVIDNFHLLNDKHGRLITEEVTLLVARIMNTTFRAQDRLYHFGDEQFAVLFHCPEEPLALGAFERVRANVERYTFPQVGRVTISAGFTRVLADDTPATALERTQDAIDFAQKDGRNKVCSYPDLVRRGVLGEVAGNGAVDLS